jgi:hypothetical protein
MPAYDLARFSPPAPVAIVTLRSPQSGKIVTDVPVLLDTGADVSLVPRAAVELLQIPDDAGYAWELEGFDGSSTIVPAAELEVLMDAFSFQGRFPLLDQHYGILGRNILNLVCLRLDGPRLVWEVLTP